VVVHPAVVEGQDRGARPGRALNVDDAPAGGGQAAAGRDVAVHLGVVHGHPPVVHDSGPCRMARGVVVHLAVVQRRIAAVGNASAGERRTLPGGGGGRVAVDSAVVQRQMAGERRGGSATAAGDAAAVQRGVAVDLAVVDGCGAKQVLDAATSGVGGGVVVNLAAVDGQKTAGGGEVQVVAAGDPAADEPL